MDAETPDAHTPGPDDAPETAVTPLRRRLLAARGVALRALASIFIAGLLGSPLAIAWAITHTEVHDTIGTSPATFTLSTRGNSELRLGLAGTIYVPESAGPFGMVGLVATVDGPGDPGAGDGDLANYLRPEMLALYAGLYHDPQAAIDEYAHLVQDDLEHQLVVAGLIVTLGGGAIVLGFSYLLPWGLGTGRGLARVVVAGGLVLVATTVLAVVQVQASSGGRGPTSGDYALGVLDGTLAGGATTNSPVLRALAGGALAKTEVLVQRQEAQEAAYRAQAEDDLTAQTDAMEAPREGETAVLMQSDMHCNTTMIRLQTTVMATLRDRDDGQPALMAITGDLTTNGTGAEGTCIRNEAKIADGAPIAAITGNHESGISRDQMADAGMTVLDGSIDELAGVRVLGDGDPNRSELFGGTAPRGDETQEGQGQRLRAEADDADADDRPDLVLVHEAYAAQAFLGVDSVDEFLAQTPASSLTTPVDDGDDGVDDVPASAVFYGHWHRSIEPRVIWNSDGSWTFVMELDTSGGAIDTPTLNNFSTPWSRPQQEASFPVVFLDEETRMVTGYQIYTFATDGTATVEPRVDVGAP